MPTSSITSIDFRNVWKVGDSTTFQSQTTTVAEEPFLYPVVLDPVTPQTEKAVVYVKPLGASNTDSGVFFGGNFKPAMGQMEILGDVTEPQKAVIRANISPLISSNMNGEDAFTFNVTPIARAGAQMFKVLLPYVEQNIVNDSPLIDIGFLRIDGSSALDNPTFVTVDRVNSQLVIDGGFDSVDIPGLKITNISSGRTLASAEVEKSEGVFTLDWSESLNGRTLLNIDNDNVIVGCSFSSTLVDIGYDYAASIAGDTLTVTVSESVVSTIGSTPQAAGGAMFQLFVGNGLELSLSFSARTNLHLEWRLQSTIPESVRKCKVFEFATDVGSSQIDTIALNFSATSLRVVGQYRAPNGQIFSLDQTFNYIAGTNNFASLAVNIQDIFNTLNTLYGIKLLYQWPLGRDTFGNAQASVNDLALLPISIMQVSTAGVRWPTFSANDSLHLIFPHQDTLQTADIDVSVDSGLTIEGVVSSIRAAILPYCIMSPPGRLFSSLLFDTVYSSCDTGSQSSARNILAAAIHNQSMNNVGWTTSGPNIVNRVQGGVIFAKDVYRTASNNFSISAYSTFNALAGAIETAFDEQSVACRTGLHYGSILPSAAMPSSGSWTANSIFTSPGFIDIKAGAGSVVTTSYSKTLDGSVSVAQLAADFNTQNAGVFQASIQSSNNSTSDANLLVNAGPFSVINVGSSCIFDIATQVAVVGEYGFLQYPTLAEMADIINTEWNSRGITASVFDDTQSYVAESITANLTAVNGINVYDSSWILFGKVHSVVDPEVPSYDVTFDFNIRFADSSAGSGLSGIQVAFGGYEKDGELVLSQSPNSFEEPGFNTFFPVDFRVPNVQKVYLLLRSRQDLDGLTFSSRDTDYAAVARYFNNFPSQSLPPLTQSSEPFLTAWTETNIGLPTPSPQVPIALCVPMSGPKVDVHIDDVSIRDSINVTIENLPDALEDFAFLAINRSNVPGSMQNSKQGRVFGLVLDNRGIWDILIGPESEIDRVVAGGDFSYLGNSYDRTPLSADEGFNFTLTNGSSLPASVRNSISLIPVPGYPQVWVLRLERGVKDYLQSLRAGAKKNTKDGCSIDIDLEAVGRTSGVPGTCRITVYADVYCVFDVNLCDAYWNLKDPPMPSGPELIANRLTFAYQSLIDCNHLETTINNGTTTIAVPILLHAESVPMFRNGNGLLLVKAAYSAEIQSFYSPTGVDLQGLQFEDCSTVSDNAPLAIRLNKPLLYLPNVAEPITDPIQIEQLLTTEESYMLVKPSFQFPASDLQKECGPTEIVIVGLGYQFKNWRNGVREDDILFGVQLHIPNDSFVLPQLNLCYRYYYNQKES